MDALWDLRPKVQSLHVFFFGACDGHGCTFGPLPLSASLPIFSDACGGHECTLGLSAPKCKASLFYSGAGGHGCVGQLQQYMMGNCGPCGGGRMLNIFVG